MCSLSSGANLKTPMSERRHFVNDQARLFSIPDMIDSEKIRTVSDW